MGFHTSKADSSLVIYSNESNLCYLLVYVDDLVITGNNPTLVTTFIQQLGNMFSLKDMGPLHFFLGVEVIPTKAGLFLTQHKYIRELLANSNMSGAKDISTPLSTYSHFNWLMAPLLWTAQNFAALWAAFNTSL